MNRTFVYTIDETNQGLNVGTYLKSVGYSRQVLIHLKKTPNSILKNGIWCYVNEVLQVGDILEVKVEELQSSQNIVPVDLPIDILYEDEDLMILNKASDMPIHPSQGNFDNTLANGVMHYFQKQQIPYVYRCITRLDRDTTGVLLLAKNMVSAAILSDMMVRRLINRTYLAIASGHISKSGRIDAPIGRVEGSTIERKIDYALGEYAVTNYHCLEHTHNYSLVALKLDTGRTHQIRVHMQHLGHPLIGDFIYNPDFTDISRQALHSHTLSFLHPITKKPLHFEATIPPDMLRVLEKDRV